MNKRKQRYKRKWYKYLLSFILIVPNMAYASNITTVQTVELKNVFISPLKMDIEVLSSFGEIREGYVHQGIDIRTPIGTPIYAASDGVVLKAAPDSKGIDAGGGNIIILSHSNNEQTWYMHLDSYAVKFGDKISKGQLIGYTGCTGDSTVPLLHFEYRKNGVALDGMFIFEKAQEAIKLQQPFFIAQT